MENKKEEEAKNVRAIKIAYHPDRFSDKDNKEDATKAIQELEDDFNKKYNNKKKVNGT